MNSPPATARTLPSPPLRHLTPRYVCRRVPQMRYERGGDSCYARIALEFPDQSGDFALVDGHYRDYSAKFILPKIKAGGMLIIDNANLSLPGESKSPIFIKP